MDGYFLEKLTPDHHFRTPLYIISFFKMCVYIDYTSSWAQACSNLPIYREALPIGSQPGQAWATGEIARTAVVLAVRKIWQVGKRSWFQAMKGAPKTFPKVVHPKGEKPRKSAAEDSSWSSLWCPKLWGDFPQSPEAPVDERKGFCWVEMGGLPYSSTLMRECSCIILYNPFVYFSIQIVYDLFPCSN